ncbi:hypothetical protein A9Q99_15355 [Gammaproteobacteria bacterium 45_16_T64]|nr:hypothetical protein A9Q99_15355 [Gammaproteobacteria bacterium 45_16_T64]
MRTSHILSMLLITTALIACGGGNGKHGGPDRPVFERDNFNQLVIDIIQQTDDSAEPININNLTLEFDNNDENAFNALF